MGKVVELHDPLKSQADAFYATHDLRWICCAWCGRQVAHGAATDTARSLRSFSPLIGGGHECKDNAACAERMRKAGK